MNTGYFHSAIEYTMMFSKKVIYDADRSVGYYTY